MNKVNAIKNKQDLQRMAKWLKINKPKYYVIFLFALNSGLRISDVLALNIEDVENKNYIELKEQKTGKNKCFPINSQVQKVIKEYLKIRKNEYSLDEDNPLFVGKKHKRIDRSSVYRVLNECAKQLGFKINIGCHSTRKTFGYTHYRQYNDIALLQTILNHSSPSITLRYIDVTQEDIDNSYLNLDLGLQGV